MTLVAAPARTPIFVDERGMGAPVVFLHSSGGSSRQWARTADALVARGGRAVLVDMAGSGRSAPIAEGVPFSFQDDVTGVSEVFARFEGGAHLVGHSYGGLIALLLALAVAPLSLAVYDPVAFGVLEPGRDDDALADRGRVRLEPPPAPADRARWLASFVDYWGGQGAWDQLRPAARDEFVRAGHVVFEGARTLSADRTPARAYASLSCPTLIMGGAASPPAARRVVERLSETIPGARTETFAGAGHMGPLTHGARFDELLFAHLSRAGALGG